MIDLKTIQTKLGITSDGIWGEQTANAIWSAIGGDPMDIIPPNPVNVRTTPKDYISTTLMKHEGGLSLDKKDTGNWYKGVLVGSKYGITANALASYRKTTNITAQDMSNLTRTEAINIAYDDYYRKPGLDSLPWNQVTASVLDMGYNAGPKRAIMLLQKMLGLSQDGKIGPNTIAAYNLACNNLVKAAIGYCNERIQRYQDIINRNSSQAKYRTGWINRAKSFLPHTTWWNKF